MKKIFISMVVVMFAAVSLPGFVMAQDDSGTNDAATDQQTDDDATSDSSDTDRASDRQTRIDAIKDRITDRLSAAEERRVAGVCKAAQTIVNRLQENLNTATENRSAKYTEVIEKLNTLLTRLQETTADTSALEAAITEIDSQANALVAAINSYQLLLDDLASMDCEEDPSGFKAVLSDARTTRGNLVAQAMTLKTYVTEDVRTILSTIKDQLSTEES